MVRQIFCGQTVQAESVGQLRLKVRVDMARFTPLHQVVNDRKSFGLISFCNNSNVLHVHLIARLVGFVNEARVSHHEQKLN
jgi:hypothetical protein